MYQIILIIENSGNFTPTRCRATRRRETVLAVENGAVNYNASSPRTIIPSQCSFLTTMGVALMGVRLQPGSLLKPPSPHDFPVRVNSNRVISFGLFLGRIHRTREKKRYSSPLRLQRQDPETRNGQVAEYALKENAGRFTRL